MTPPADPPHLMLLACPRRAGLVLFMTLLASSADAQSGERVRWSAEVPSRLDHPRLEFEIDSPELRPSAAPILDAVADRLHERLRSSPTARFEIQGHTDPRWHCPHCARDLPARRAQSVRQQLVRRGLPADRLEARGHGGDRPLVDCRRRGNRCRARNRRIEIHELSAVRTGPRGTLGAERASRWLAGGSPAASSSRILGGRRPPHGRGVTSSSGEPPRPVREVRVEGIAHGDASSSSAP